MGDELKRVDRVGGLLACLDGSGEMARTAPNDRSCMDADCGCCERWQEISGRSLAVGERLAHIASTLAGENTSNEGIIKTL